MDIGHTLTRHRDIRAWVAARKGMPAMVRAHNDYGQVRARLALRFNGPGRPRGLPRVDQGASPISWDAWLAELDRQQLALKVSDTEDGYELVARQDLH
jgi:hypothetical protein